MCFRFPVPSFVWLLCSVRDTGIGMSAETVEHLFEPYRQSSYQLSRAYGGESLIMLPMISAYLSLRRNWSRPVCSSLRDPTLQHTAMWPRQNRCVVKSLLDSMCGTVDVESMLGVGSTFTVM